MMLIYLLSVLGSCAFLFLVLYVSYIIRRSTMSKRERMGFLAAKDWLQDYARQKQSRPPKEKWNADSVFSLGALSTSLGMLKMEMGEIHTSPVNESDVSSSTIVMPLAMREKYFREVVESYSTGNTMLDVADLPSLPFDSPSASIVKQLSPVKTWSRSTTGASAYFESLDETEV